MENLKIRKATEKDASLLRHIANNSKPLDLHTQYTYWVITNFYGDGCFILSKDEKDIGFISSVSNNEYVFIWQIGILPEFRNKKYSSKLIDEVVKYAKSLNKKIQVTIAEDNKISYNAFSGYCKNNNLEFKKVRVMSVDDLDDKSFLESEIVYDLIY